MLNNINYQFHNGVGSAGDASVLPNQMLPQTKKGPDYEKIH